MRLLLFFTVILLSCNNVQHNHKYKGWPVYGGSGENIKYSSSSVIDTNNVSRLAIAWQFNTNDADSSGKSQIQCNAIVVDGVLYASSPKLQLFALNASTGKLIWIFNPADTAQNPHWYSTAVNINRGVSYWTSGTDKRIFYTVGSSLLSINATTGELINTFGQNGGIDLHHQLDREDIHNLYIAPTSPGMIYKNLYIVGGRVSEGQDAAPGHIRAFDVLTGERKWIFHTIPQPGQFGFDTWNDSIAYRNIGGANNWSGFSLDEERGILFAPTGSASFDFYGGKRLGDNLFANSLLALNAATGERIWHYQFVHHDVWDRDVPAPPALVTATLNGKSIDAVAQTTKQGYVFLFNRTTGEPLFKIDELPVPQHTDLYGEVLSPTQPAPSKPEPFVRQTMDTNSLNNLIPDSSYQIIKNRLLSSKSGHMFNAPSLQGTVILPGFDGGAEWGGPAWDPETGLLYVNANEMPWILTMIPAQKKHKNKETLLQAGKRLYARHCQNCHAPDLNGAGNYPPVTNIKQQYTQEHFDKLLKEGRRMMPSFQYLAQEERKALATFILQDEKQYQSIFEAPQKEENDYLDLPYSFTGYNKFLTPEGYPAISPPWGTLNAIDINNGEIAWSVPLGEYPELSAKDIPLTGTENYGGPVVTAGGLIFIAATRDEKIRAFNKYTGALLWEHSLPAAGYATPTVYEIDGKQFVVIACGGGKLGTASGDSYVAFSIN